MARPTRKPRISPDDEVKYREFAGLVNVQSSKDIGLRALTIADNVFITDTKKIRTRPGNSLFRSGAIQTAFARGPDLYVVDGGTLKRVLSDTDAHDILAGLTGTNYCWDDVNGESYFVNGAEAGILRGDSYKLLRVPAPTITSVTVQVVATPPDVPFNVGESYDQALWRMCATYEYADGRESAPSETAEIIASPLTISFLITVPLGGVRTNVYISEPNGTVFRMASTTTSQSTFTVPARAVGRDLTTYRTWPLPEGVDQIAYWQGRIHAGQYFPDVDQSVIWPSKPFAFHLYAMGEDFVVLPGRVAMMLWTKKGLLIGTTQVIVALSEDGVLDTLITDYGVVPGVAGDTTPEGDAYFWTERGFCKYPEFENLTEKHVGMPPGLRANTQLVYLDGMQQLITITQGGGLPFNVRS